LRIPAPFFEDLIDACVMESYFRRAGVLKAFGIPH